MRKVEETKKNLQYIIQQQQEKQNNVKFTKKKNDNFCSMYDFFLFFEFLKVSF